MTIPFICPHCGKQTEVADAYSGQSGPCSGCGQTVTVPAFAGQTPFVPPPRKSHALLITILVVAGLMVTVCPCMLGLLLPAVNAVREKARQAGCMNNLKQIALAMQSYEVKNVRLPPAYLADKQGRPLLSWRVLLLPYLNQENLYKRFHLDEPWDSPHNRPLADEMPSVFLCPSRRDSELLSKTTYMVVVGPHTAFTGKDGVALDKISDGVAHTILVAEVGASGVIWTSPTDVDVKTVCGQIGVFVGFHPGGANVAMCDGSVHFISAKVDLETIRRLVTRDDGLPVDESKF